MLYTKPELRGYSAIAAIQSNGQAKKMNPFEPGTSSFSTPAYEADE